MTTLWYQLFGNYTELPGSSQTPPVKGAGGYHNGYEALATLDINHDNEISGKELKPLALWFDNNQDGISQKGEVQDISKAGITKLFFETSYCDLETGDIHAKVGYERIVNGKKQIGASVDWYAEGPFDTKEEAMVGKEYIVGIGFVDSIKKFEGRD